MAKKVKEEVKKVTKFAPVSNHDFDVIIAPIVTEKTMKLWKAEIVPGTDATPGQIIFVDKQSFTVQTGEGGLRVMELQMEGKKRMDAGAFLRGCALSVGEMLG